MGLNLGESAAVGRIVCPRGPSRCEFDLTFNNHRGSWSESFDSLRFQSFATVGNASKFIEGWRSK